MHVYKLKDPDEKHLYLDWDEIIKLDTDQGGVTILLDANHPLVEDYE